MLCVRTVRPTRSTTYNTTMQCIVALVLALCVGVVAGQGKTTRSYNRPSKAEPPARPNSYLEEQVQPIFDNTTNRNVTTQLGKTAYLHCRVKNLGDRTVSWIRRRDLHVLTVGRYTYTSDQRFQSIHLEQSEDWTLQIKYPQKRDAGVYECQVSTEPKLSIFVNLNVVGYNWISPWTFWRSEMDEDSYAGHLFPSTSKPQVRRPKSNQRVATATILGYPDLYIKSGSTINLTCSITQSPQPPAFLFWYHNQKVINYDSRRGGVNVVTEKSETTTSKLLISNAQTSDSGNYTCSPSNADAVSIIVHVLNGEKPAAMQHGGQTDVHANALVAISAVLLSTMFVTLVPVVR